MTDLAQTPVDQPNAALIDIVSSRGEVESYSVAELTELAAQAKTKVKAIARGWSMLSKAEILALAWFADVCLQDADLPDHPPAQAAPAVISNV